MRIPHPAWILSIALAARVVAADAVPAGLPGAEAFSAELRQRLIGTLAEQGSDYVPRTQQRNADGTPRFTNRLLLERSPYLRQHAHNPVNWYPWGEEAFAAAKRLGRPLFVSIGYSTCHWCHVMEEESFDDPKIATVLNQHFISIKVDREARPDVDSVYMTAVNAMGERGGWPLNVWLTPDRKPFFGGTYFPPRASHGRPGFSDVLRAIHAQYTNDRARVSDLADQVSKAVEGTLEGVRADSSRLPGPEVARQASAAYAAGFDDGWGGLRGQQKFPSSLPVRFLLRHHRRSGDARALAMAVQTLEKIAAGGIHDHIGGGFHRYSTDPRWAVPHFEKMLYDNALLVLDFVEAWQVTGRADFAGVARSTLDYVGRELKAPEGAFYSATDADSLSPSGEMEEGRYFTWTPAELEAALGAETAAVVGAWYDLTKRGNLDGRSVLATRRSLDATADQFGLEPKALRRTLEQARESLLAVRARRVPPLRDEKVLVAWNGLMISAFARAGFALDEPAYVETAQRAAAFILERMRTEGRLRRVYRGGHAEGPAFLEDYAFLVAALLDLYEAEPQVRWLREAIALQRVLDANYLDDAGGGYFRSAADGERLLAREKPARDGALPSGNSVAALNLLRLTAFTQDESYRERALLLFSAFAEALGERPTSLAELALALDYELDTGKEILVVRPSTGGDAAALLAGLRRSHVPNRIVSVVAQGDELDAHAELIPLLRSKVARKGEVTAYVCEDRVCRFPTTDPAEFAAQLARVEPLEPPPLPPSNGP